MFVKCVVTDWSGSTVLRDGTIDIIRTHKWLVLKIAAVVPTHQVPWCHVTPVKLLRNRVLDFARCLIRIVLGTFNLEKTSTSSIVIHAQPLKTNVIRCMQRCSIERGKREIMIYNFSNNFLFFSILLRVRFFLSICSREPFIIGCFCSMSSRNKFLFSSSPNPFFSRDRQK